MTVFYDPQANIIDRLAMWLTECNANSINLRQALIVGAVSWNECACMMRVKRSEMLLMPPECYPQRPPMIVENGSAQLGTSFLNAWKNDPELMAVLKDHGWVNKAGTGLTSEASLTDAPKTPNDIIAWFFEWLMDQRKTAALGAYSIGPTQAYLKFSPLTGAKPGIPNRAPTIENLFAFYTADNPQAMFQTGMFDYLPTNVSSYPRGGKGMTSGGGNASVGNPNAVETYLSNFQTGQRDWDDPVWKRYSAQFLNAVEQAWFLVQGDNSGAGGWKEDPFNDLGRL